MKRMLSASLALVFFCFVADSLACSNDNPNCQVTTGVIVVNKNTASNDNTVSNDNRIDIKGDDYEVPIPSIPIINFGPGLSGTGSMIDFWAYPGVFDLNGARTEIVPFRNVSIQWIRGTGFFKRRLPDGVVYYRKLWTITYNGQRDRHVMKADEAEVVFKAALMKAQKVASEASELLMVTV